MWLLILHSDFLLLNFRPLIFSFSMDIVALNCQLVDIESITGNEGPVGRFLEQHLRGLGYESQRMPVEGERANV